VNGSNLFVVTISLYSRLFLSPRNLRYAVNEIVCLIPDSSPVIFSRAFGQAADRAHEFAHLRFDVCKVSGSGMLFFVAKCAGKYSAKLKTRSILRSCVVLH